MIVTTTSNSRCSTCTFNNLHLTVYLPRGMIHQEIHGIRYLSISTFFISSYFLPLSFLFTNVIFCHLCLSFIPASQTASHHKLEGWIRPPSLIDRGDTNQYPTMARHNHGRLALLLVLSTLAVVSCRREVRPHNAFLPKRITDTVASSTQSVVDLKKDHLNDVLSSNNLQRGGAIPLPASNELSGAAIFLVLDHLFRKIFQAKGISFPSQLGGCCILFVLMNLLEVVKPGLGDAIFTSLTPGAGFLAKWLPVFFVPGLAMLPLAPSMGSPVEVSHCICIYTFIRARHE